MIIKILDANFNRALFNHKAPHPLQSWQWGEARKKMGIEVLRIGDGKNIYQLTFHKIPFTNFKLGYLPRSVLPTKETLTFLATYGRKNNVVFIKIEPYSLRIVNKNNYASLDSSVVSLPQNDIKIIKSPHPLFPNWTIMVNLTKSEDELLEQMKPKTRYNIKLAQKKGVVVKEMSNDEGFKIFSKLYFETCKRQKYFGHTPKYHQIIWNNLKNNIARILVAFYNYTPLAAYELFYFQKIMYYPYGGTAEEFRNVMASNLLMWEAIRLGKKLGAEKFDMWGSLSPNYNQNHPWAGFTRFKEGYGGEFVEMIGSYDLVMNQTLYQIYNFLNQLRSTYLKLKRLI